MVTLTPTSANALRLGRTTDLVRLSLTNHLVRLVLGLVGVGIVLAAVGAPVLPTLPLLAVAYLIHHRVQANRKTVTLSRTDRLVRLAVGVLVVVAGLSFLGGAVLPTVPILVVAFIARQTVKLPTSRRRRIAGRVTGGTLLTGFLAGLVGTSTASALPIPGVTGLCGLAPGPLQVICGVAGPVAGPVAGAAAGAAGQAATQWAGEAALGGLTSWVAHGAVWFGQQFINSIFLASSPNLMEPWFLDHYKTMIGVSFALGLLLFVIAVGTGTLTGNGSMLAQAVWGIPVAIIAAQAMPWLVQGLVALDNVMSAAVSNSAGADATASLTVGINFLASNGANQSNALIAGIVVFVSAAAMLLGGALILLDFVMRATGIYIGTFMSAVFLMLLIWKPTARWARIALELVIVLIFSKFFIVSIASFGLAALAHANNTGAISPLFTAASTGAAASGGGSLVPGNGTVSDGNDLQGVANTLVGGATLIAAVAAPFTILRFIPAMDGWAAGRQGSRGTVQRVAGNAAKSGGKWLKNNVSNGGAGAKASVMGGGSGGGAAAAGAGTAASTAVPVVGAAVVAGQGVQAAGQAVENRVTSTGSTATVTNNTSSSTTSSSSSTDGAGGPVSGGPAEGTSAVKPQGNTGSDPVSGSSKPPNTSRPPSGDVPPPN